MEGQILKSLIYAQAKQIGKSKFLVIELFFSPLLFLFISYNRNNSLTFSSQVVISFGILLLATLGSEILNLITVDEIKDGIFDIILISTTNKVKILFGKIVIPVLGVLSIICISILLNNALTLKYHFEIIKLDLNMMYLILMTTLFSCFLEFISLLYLRRRDKAIHAYVIWLGMIFSAIFLFLSYKKMYILFYVFSLFIIISEMVVILILLTRKYQLVKTRRLYFSSIFDDYDKWGISLFIRKNISALRLGNKAIGKLFIATILPVLGAILCKNNETISNEFVFLLSVTSVQVFFVTYFILFTNICENRNNIKEILLVAQKGRYHGVIEKSISSGFILTLICLVNYIIINILLYKINIGCILYTTLNNFLSAIVCSICFRNVNQYRYVEQLKIFISVLCIAMQCIAYVIIQ